MKCKLQFVELLDRRNGLPSYHVIASQSADWRGNLPVQ